MKIASGTPLNPSTNTASDILSDTPPTYSYNASIKISKHTYKHAFRHHFFEDLAHSGLELLYISSEKKTKASQVRKRKQKGLIKRFHDQGKRQYKEDLEYIKACKATKKQKSKRTRVSGKSSKH